MSDQTAPEPTMEEILASIRRIISEDDAPKGDVAQASAAADEDDDVLELTERADEAPPAESGEEIMAPPPGNRPSTDPTAVPLTTGSAACLNSFPVIHRLPNEGAVTSRAWSLRMLATISVNAKRPMATATNSIPSVSAKEPKVKR